MKTLPVYKITTKDCLSCMSLGKNFPLGLALTYSVDKWTVPEIAKSGLFVFADLMSASRFFNTHLKYNEQWVIWEAIAMNPRIRQTVLSVNNRFMGRLQNFWLRVSRRGARRRAFSRYGFYVCDAVKLTKMVEPILNASYVGLPC